MTTQHPTHHQWESPHEWLEDKVSNDDLLNFVLATTTADQIQDYFQSQMDEDGYFTAVYDETCAVCDEDIEVNSGEQTCAECGGLIHDTCGEEDDGGRYVCDNCQPV